MTDDNRDTLIGQHLGKYELVEYLGFGAMAKVYKGYHSSLDRHVAVKVLHSHLAADGEFLRQFNDEARNLATMRHPNIVQVFDFDLHDGKPYMIMEFIDGPTLDDVIEDASKRHSRVSNSRTIRIIQNIGVALSYAHKRRIIHRDVKPRNVMLERTGRVVLGDFGLARLLTVKRRTEHGQVKGTPAYMPPEQGRGEAGEERSDIYSLGAIFYELVTGRLPFVADTPVAVAMKHISEPLTPPKELVPEIPESIQRMILKAMEKDPRDRYQSVDKMLEDIARFNKRVKTKKLPTARLTMPGGGKAIELPTAPELSSTGTDAEVSLHFMDTGQILNLKRGREYSVGRRHKQQAVIPDIDLAPFKAYDWGISRIHARIDMVGDSVKVMDLGSSNGTWYDGKRLPPNTPFNLRHGDIFFLGKLKIQVLIYD